MKKFHIHEVGVRMTEDRDAVQDFLNTLEGEVIAIIPNVHSVSTIGHVGVDFLWVVEKDNVEK
jgi:hypothetical protein